MNAKLLITLMLGASSSMSATAKEVYNKIKDNEVKDTSLYATKKIDEVIINGSKPLYTSSKLSGSLRLNQPLVKIPQNIQIVNKALLNDLSILSADEGIQRTVSGVSKLEHWSDYVRINMRGSRAAAFREGMNVTSTWGPMTEDMSYVDRIEFVKGPAGFMMSNGEPSGLYNVVTKKPTGEDKGQIGLTVGSYDLYRTTLDLDGHLDKSHKLLYRLNLMGMSANSMRANEFTKRYSIAPVLRYLIDEKSVLTLEYDLQYMQSSNIGGTYVFSPGGYKSLPRDYSLLEPGMEPTTSHDHTAILNFQHDFNTDWKLTAQAAYFNYNRTGSSLWASSVKANGDEIRYASNADVLNEMKFAQLYLNGKFHTKEISHTLLGGLDMGDKHAWYDWSQSHTLDSTGTFNVFKDTPNGFPYYGYSTFDRSRNIKERANNTQISESFYGIYLQDVLGFFHDHLRLTLAARFTHVEDASYGTSYTNCNHFSPRIGLSYSLAPFTSVYLLYDQTFNPQMGVQRNGNSVKPVVSNNWEAGMKRYWFGGRLQTTLALYHILIDHQTSSDPQNTGSENYLIQVGQSVSKGIEFDLNGELLPGLNLLANYAFTDYKVTKSEDASSPSGTRLPGYAKHEFNIWLKYRIRRGPIKGFSASLGETSLLDRSTWAWTGSDNGEALPDYIRVDGALGWKNDKLSVNLNVNNIMNAYLLSGSRYNDFYYWQSEPGRNFRLSVTYNF